MMRKLSSYFLILIPFCLICALIVLCWLLRSELLTFLRSLKIYAIILVPVFFIIGAYIFEKYKWAVTAILSLWCLIILAASSWLAIVTMFSVASADSDANSTIDAYLTWIYAAEIGLILVIAASAIANYRLNKRLDENSDVYGEKED